ncbi:hypothetical protein [Cohnella silvisoli]|uniref:Uncharacterized protein n=1 Tax=Cohnella silvisoli TaxID=2873699 RepID=A0ABV1KNZ2_9BACL|nr:hypothetical protein [Cohnella silvisoli]MCD9020902.1 hypothetical protein [Cohnella silvisoli]
MKRLGRGMTAVLAVAVTCMLLEHRFTVYAAEKPQKSKMTITVRSSRNATSFSRLEIDSPNIAKALIHAKKENDYYPPYLTDIDVALLQGEHEQHYRLERSGNLWDEPAMTSLLLPAAVAGRLLSYAEGLRHTHYGKLTRWDEARNIITRKSIFSVTDLESGLTFKVQRRAGSAHADVQPLTKEDSKIMKSIYNGRWSWKRKAIVVQSGHGRLAASMNGMPHGGDGIPGNGFSGHFCIHFLGSTTHRSDVPDPVHQMMVYKASGNLRAYFDSAAPEVLAESFIEAMYQQDPDMLRQVSEGAPREKLAYFLQEMESLKSIRIHVQRTKLKAKKAKHLASEERLSAEIKLPVFIQKKGKPFERSSVYSFFFRREFPQSPWRIEDVQFRYSSFKP